MSTVAKKVIMGSGAVAEFEVEQSLIFNNDTAHLKRTPGTAGNRRTWTLSFWAKNLMADDGGSFFGVDVGSFYFEIEVGAIKFAWLNAGVWQIKLVPIVLLRDPASWYHILLAVDTTQSTSTNRVKFYFNGVQITSFNGDNNTFPSQNLETPMNGAYEHFIGATRAGERSANSYLAEMHLLDGAVKAPSDFIETNSDTGQLVPKEYEGGSYGTNGFYLKFASDALGTDSSGEGNNYTAVNLANSDVVIDAPTNNCMTLNPLEKTSSQPLTEGNLFAGSVSGETYAAATYYPTGGKFYYEYKLVQYSASGSAVAYFKHHSGSYIWNDVFGSSYQIIGSEGNTTISNNWASGNIIQIAVDETAGKLWYGRNNTWYTVDGTPNPATGSGPSHTFTTPSTQRPLIDIRTGGSQVQIEANYGQRDFAYTPPSGFVAPTAKNLPEPAIPLPSAHFNTVLYAGTGSAQTISGVGFQPDFSWTKCRSAATWHRLVDAVRGSNKEYFSNDAYAEINSAGGARAMTFESDGFAWGGNSGDVNGSGRNYVSWNWKANGAGSTDTSGDIDATVSANPTSGFSIVKYTATSDPDATVPHGLGVAPEMVFYKWGSSAWFCWTTVIDGSNDRLVLDRDDAKTTVSATYGSFTSDFIRGIDVSTGVIAYCFVSIPGFSKIGVYTGNGSNTGPFVNLGFKPAWVMIKGTSAANEWYMYDGARSPANEINYYLEADTADAEAGMDKFDFLSNGFKIRNAYGGSNTNNGVYLYMAFAEAPFKYANARP